MSKIKSLEKQLVIAKLSGRTTKAFLLKSALRTEHIKEAIQAEHGISQGKSIDDLKKRIK